MYENGEIELLKTLDDIYETNFFYKSRELTVSKKVNQSYPKLII